MRLSAVILMILPLWCTGPARADSPRQTVILSYFEGFGGSETNPSESIANAVKANLVADPGVELILCAGNEKNGLKVAFFSDRNDLEFGGGRTGSLQGHETAFEQLSRCYAEHPDAKEIVSLAQGECELNVAGSAFNAMSTGKNKKLSDNNENFIPAMQKIDLNGPDLIFTDDLNILSSCAMEDRTVLKLTNDIGAYVCNNLTYNFEKKILAEHLPVTYSMIHVPLDLKNFKNKCDQKEYKNALKERGEKLTDETMNTLVADQITSFIRSKNGLIVHYAEIQSDPAKITNDILFKPVPLNTPEMHDCVNHQAALRAGAQNIFAAHFRANH